MSAEEEVLQTLRTLIHAIPLGDVETYKKLSSENLTAFEPESESQLVEGLPFHEFFLNRPNKNAEYHLEIVNPVIRVYGDTAYAAYSLVKLTHENNKTEHSGVNETRIFHKFESGWKMVHFHRS